MLIDENIKSVLPEKYALLKCFKKSNLGGVYLVKNLSNKKKFIIKVLDNLSADSESKNRFKREAKILSQIKHTNIIQIDDWGIENDISFISFEYFESKNLREFVKNRKLSDEEKLKITKQFLSGLNFLHKNSIIHRDIKPDNILVNEKLKLKISDFGLSLLLEDDFTTKIDLIVGTPSYMSPEQIQGQKLTYQSDLFSAGALIYELYTNKNLFLSSDFNKTINNILNFNTSRIDELSDTIPEIISKILKLLLSVELEQRINSAEEILSILDGKSVGTFQNSKLFNRKKMGIYAIAFLSVTLFIFLVLTSSSKEKSNELGNKLVDNILNEPIEKTNEGNLDLDMKKSEKLNQNITKNIETDNKEKVNESNVYSNELEPDNLKSVSKESTATIKTNSKNIFVDSYPWAKVFINDSLIDTTPMEKKIQLKYGEYKIAFVHPGFPRIENTLIVNAKSDDSIIVNLEKSLSYFKCKVFPWGEVFIDEKYLGQTPINQTIPVLPGQHKILITNPSFNNFTNVINFTKSDTTMVNINFNNLN